MSIAVRRATTKDAALIATLIADVQALHAAALPRFFKPADKISYAADAAEVLANPERLIFIAYVADEPAGFIHAQMIHQAETSLICAQHTLYIHTISVRPNYRRRGVGSALMAAVRAAGKSMRIERLVLDVWTFNEAARAFFRRQGLTACCERYVTASDLGAP
jgi:ribosomal protein S18 acetylase RimI-like enzyme